MPSSNLISIILVGNTEQQVLGPNANRKSVTFGCPTSSTYQLRNDALGNVVGGFGVATSSGTVTLTREEHGDIVCKPWFAFSASGIPFGIIETIY